MKLFGIPSKTKTYVNSETGEIYVDTEIGTGKLIFPEDGLHAMIWFYRENIFGPIGVEIDEPK